MFMMLNLTYYCIIILFNRREGDTMKKNRELITLVLRDALQNPHEVKVPVGKIVEIAVYGNNMVLVEPKQYDTNPEDGSKKYRFDGWIVFPANPRIVREFNKIEEAYDAQDYIYKQAKKHGWHY